MARNRDTAFSELRVLFVADRSDAPFRYRCVHACSELRKSGALSNVMRLDQPGILHELAHYSVIVLFRLPWSQRVESLVSSARQFGVPLVFDCDDLVFDPAAAPLIPFRHELDHEEWERSYGRDLRALRRSFDACDLFVGSTPALTDWATRLGKPARTHPNAVPDEYVRLARWLRRPRPDASQRTIGYFAGSNTHDRDFSSVVSALRRVLEAMPETRLLIGGFLDAGTALRGFEHRVVRLPHVGFRALPWAFLGCDVTIAPISELTPFTHGKSALKFFEPGVFGVPTVATPIEAMKSAIVHGETGWLAEEEPAWIDALKAALDPANNQRVGLAARKAVLERHTSRALSDQLAAILAEIAVPPKGEAPKRRPFKSEEYGGKTDGVSRTLAVARRAREVLRVRVGLNEPSDAGPSLLAADALIHAVLSGAPPPDDVAVLIAGSPLASGWRLASQIESGSSSLGEDSLVGPDPHFESPAVELGAKRFRYAIVRMRLATESLRASAELYWRSAHQGHFKTDERIAFAIAANGMDATYVLDLWKSGDADFWRKTRDTVRFRFDPADRPGTARVLLMALVPDGWDWADESEVRRESPVAIGRRRAFAEELARLKLGSTLWVESTRGGASFRKLLTRRLRGSGVIAGRIEASNAGARAELRRVARPSRASVDILIPVYNAREQTLACIESVLRHARGDFRVIIVDDASTDPALPPLLDAFQRADPRVRVSRNPENVGFVRSVNRGFAEASGRDVLLLNSDTRVFRGFLRGLHAAAYATERTRIACPLSNNATILSVPEFCRKNALPEGVSLKQMAALVRKSSERRRPELVTPVGFCMYVRGELLAEIGPFDEARFGRGFGEENDFGERAKALGYEIRVADDVYVWHEGKASFGEEGLALEAEHAPVLEARHPGYHERVARFVEQNPLAPIHHELARNLARFRHRQDAALMLLLHASPLREPCGGTEYVVRDLAQHLDLPRIVIANPAESAIEVVEILDGNWERASAHRFELEDPVPRVCHQHREASRVFAEILRLFRVGHVHVHHLIGWPLELEAVLEDANVPHSLSVHDYYAVCPSQNLLDVEARRLCGPEGCRNPERAGRCMHGLFSEIGLRPPEDAIDFIARHRSAFAPWFARATALFYPSESARERVESVHSFALAKSRVLPHAYLPQIAGERPLERHDGLRVALLGEVSYPSKGSEAYLEVMRRLAEEPVEWHFFGPTDRFDFEHKLGELGSRVRVVRHGSYARADIVRLLREAGVDVGLLLPIWPETFSLTLSELIAAGIPVVAAKQGAIADRLRSQSYARLVDSPAQAAAVLSELAREPNRVRPMSEALRSWTPPDAGAWVLAQREVYLANWAGEAAAPLRRREYARLADTRIELEPMAPPAKAIEPAARHRSSRWYRAAERLKPHMPESVRSIMRQRLSDERWRTLRRFRLPGRHASPGPELRLEARYLTTARFTSLGDKAYFDLDFDPIPADDVGGIRFNLWCVNAARTYAELYWRHEGDRDFSEHKHLSVEVDGRLGDWRSYLVRLDPKRHPTWYSDKALVALRFEPVSYAGPFCVGELALCAPRSG